MDIQKAVEIYSKENKCEYVCGETYESLQWLCEKCPKPTLEELENAYQNYKLDYIKSEYKRNRAAEYPSIVDQLDMIFHSGIDGWKVAIQAVKDKYPKPE